MGLPDLQRELAAESANKSRAANAKAKDISPETLVDEMWASDLVPRIVETRYRKLAAKDETLALALARFDARDQQSNRALFEENAELIAPLVASQLGTERGTHAAQLLGNVCRRASRAIPAPRAPQKIQGRGARVLERVGARAHRQRRGPGARRARRRSEASWSDDRRDRGARRSRFRSARDRIDSQMARWAKTQRAKRSRRRRATARSREALGVARSEAALPVLHEILATPYLPAAMRALSSLAHPSSREPALRILESLGGDPERNWAYRLPAEDVLRAIAIARGDRESTWPTLDCAREVIANVRPRRYGWPKVDDQRALLRLATRALRLQGTSDDVAYVASLTNAPAHAIRLEAAIAFEQVHGKPPVLHYWDPARVALAVKKKTKPSTLFAIACQPTTVFRHNIFRAVAASKDEKTRAKLADFVRAELESRPNYDVSYYEESDLGADVHGMMDALEILAKRPASKKRLAKTTSLWIRQNIFDERPPSDAWATFERAPDAEGKTRRPTSQLSRPT